jgi:uncharacterized small protein (DUF1192 family)
MNKVDKFIHQAGEHLLVLRENKELEARWAILRNLQDVLPSYVKELERRITKEKK